VRPRKAIESNAIGATEPEAIGLILEVMLDIRDLLDHLCLLANTDDEDDDDESTRPFRTR